MTHRVLLEAGPAGALLALLLAGHALGDFVFQSRTMVDNKGSSLRWLAAHAGVVTVCHLALVLPFFAGPALVLVTILGAGHIVFDRIKARLDDGSLLLFSLDQLLHLAVVVGVWRVWISWRGAEPSLPFTVDDIRTVTIAAVLVTAYAFNVNGGAAVVGLLLRTRRLTGEDAGRVDAAELARGRLIGILERMLTLTLVLVGQWAALGLLLAAKSIARFKELENREFGEYYLIGTLASLLVAIASGLAVRLLV